jgi:hypothetical protein
MNDAGLTLPDEVTPTSAKRKTNIFRGSPTILPNYQFVPAQ